MSEQTAMATQEKKECAFWKLSPELRNQVYRLVLVKPENEHPIVDDKGYERPALLQTCKQIRAEGNSIFYGENTFLVRVREFSPANLIRFADHLKVDKLDPSQRLAKQAKSRAVANWKKPNFENLMAWLRWHHAQTSEGRVNAACKGGKQDNRAIIRIIVAGMFQMANQMKSRPWEEVEGILKIQQGALAALDERWG